MLEIIEKVESQDGSVKYAFASSRGHKFEAIYYKLASVKSPTYSFSICISSQAGCAMGCTFCATGHGGFFANLLSDEMLAQVNIVCENVIQAGKEKKDAHFNIVVMGMGEPLMNYENLVDFLHLATKSLPYLDRISISTIGIVPKILALAAVPNVNKKLFVSIHSPYEVERTRIMPITKKYSLKSVLDACREYAIKTKTTVITSYLLLKDINDSEQHARDFASLLDPNFFEAQFLLYNVTPGISYGRPTNETAQRFREIVAARGINTDIQISRGRDVNGGCGQLIKEVKVRKTKSDSFAIT